MKIFKKLCASQIVIQCSRIFLLLILLNIQLAAAYDNSDFPPFEVAKDGRGINNISIHPDGERWLISECTNTEDSKRFRCDLFLYNFKTKAYQKYDLPSEYLYSDANFSPRGGLIVAVRRPAYRSNQYEEKINSFKNSEIFTIRTDSTDFKVLPNIRGHIKLPSLSDDETKIVFWQSTIVRPPGYRTVFYNFDVHEYNLSTAKEKIFAGPYGFYEARGLSYFDKDRVIVTAYGPSQYAHDIRKFSDQFNSSDIYIFERGQVDLPAPLYTEVEHAVDITLNKAGQAFLMATDRSDGISLFRFNPKPTHWRIPNLMPGGIGGLIASPPGQYVVFTYTLRRSRFQPASNSVGVFDLNEERWLPISLPSTTSAVPISHP